MPLIPIAGKNLWKNPPVITMCLILVNCFVFFFIQSGDTKREIEAESFYFQSHLAQIEISQYIRYLNESGKVSHKIPGMKHLKKEKIFGLRQRMMLDKHFMGKLRHDEVITPDMPGYDEWKNLRKEYEQRLSKVVWLTYSFKPGAPSVLTIFTSMFLHGSPGHLIGNMIFLWLSGCLLEMGLRRAFFCFTYFFTGLCSVLLFWLFNINSMIPNLGASGAISGLMGALAVLYGWRKIRVFVNLGFYFNYIKVPALLLLPIWIGSELYSLFFSGETHIAYLAHIGGLISGGAISYINQKWIRAINPETFEEEAEDKVSPLIEKALAHVEKLELERGAKLLEEAISMDPENKSALVHLFNVRKMTPKAQEFHAAAQRLLSWLILNTDDRSSIIKFFLEYKKLAGGTKLPPEIHLKLSTIFIDSVQMKHAEALLAGLMKNHPHLSGLSTAVLRLAKGYERSGLLENHQKCLKIICRKFPGSTEAAIATKSLS
jgi:membrane associated rhomboid family serine protease